MTGLDEYQEKAMTTAKYKPSLGHLYPLLGLIGEAAEVAEKIVEGVWPEGGAGHGLQIEGLILSALREAIEAGKKCERVKKLLRDCAGDLPPDQMERLAGRVRESATLYASNPEKLESVIRELGDVLWYESVLARFLGASLSSVAEKNLAKLASRKERGVLHGSGDNR